MDFDTKSATTSGSTNDRGRRQRRRKKNNGETLQNTEVGRPPIQALDRAQYNQEWTIPSTSNRVRPCSLSVKSPVKPASFYGATDSLCLKPVNWPPQQSGASHPNHKPNDRGRRLRRRKETPGENSTEQRDLINESDAQREQFLMQSCEAEGVIEGEISTSNNCASLEPIVADTTTMNPGTLKAKKDRGPRKRKKKKLKEQIIQTNDVIDAATNVVGNRRLNDVSGRYPSSTKLFLDLVPMNNLPELRYSDTGGSKMRSEWDEHNDAMQIERQLNRDWVNFSVENERKARMKESFLNNIGGTKWFQDMINGISREKSYEVMVCYRCSNLLNHFILTLKQSHILMSFSVSPKNLWMQAFVH
jgi:hypothetical protein